MKHGGQLQRYINKEVSMEQRSKWLGLIIYLSYMLRENDGILNPKIVMLLEVGRGNSNY